MKNTKKIIFLIGLCLSWAIVALLSCYVSITFFSTQTVINKTIRGEIATVEKIRGNYSTVEDYDYDTGTVVRIRLRKGFELIWEKCFYPNGQLRFICNNYVGGIPEGIVKSFFPDGTAMYVVNFKDGSKDGECFLYHSNGNLIVKANYVRGKLEGEFKSFYPDGSLLGSGIMKNSECWNGTFSRLSMDPYVWDMKDDFLEEYQDGQLIKSTKLERNFESNWPMDDVTFSFYDN